MHLINGSQIQNLVTYTIVRNYPQNELVNALTHILAIWNRNPRAAHKGKKKSRLLLYVSSKRNQWLGRGNLEGNWLCWESLGTNTGSWPPLCDLPC